MPDDKYKLRVGDRISLQILEDRDAPKSLLVAHMFNHQTHHRGQISLYLDILGKKNDFSGIAPLV